VFFIARTSSFSSLMSFLIMLSCTLIICMSLSNLFPAPTICSLIPIVVPPELCSVLFKNFRHKLVTSGALFAGLSFHHVYVFFHKVFEYFQLVTDARSYISTYG